MQPAAVPVKTPAGQDELRLRSRGLGQRYRTVLLLVDGRRPLGEVLHMALQAGAHTSHFEELVRLGLVELPQELAAPEPRETQPGALDDLRLTSVALDVLPADATPSAAPPVNLSNLPHMRDAVDPAAAPHSATAPAAWLPTEPSPLPPQESAQTLPHVTAPVGLGSGVGAMARPIEQPTVQPIAIDLPPAPPAPTVHTEWIPLARMLPAVAAEAEPEFAPESAAAPVQPSPAASAMPANPWPTAMPELTAALSAQPTALAATTLTPALTPAPAPPAVWSPQSEAAFTVADHARPAPRLSDAKRVERIRQLLLYTLGADGLLFATLTLTRVRGAQTQKDLISLVWEIERQRAHARRSREQLLSLERARELLGMGNTLVTGDSQPAWPDTEGEI